MGLDFIDALDPHWTVNEGSQRTQTSRYYSVSPDFCTGNEERAETCQHFKATHKKQLCQQVPDRSLSRANLSQRATQNLSLNSTPNTLNSCCKNTCLAHSRLPTPNPCGLPSHPGFPGSHTRTCFLRKREGWLMGFCIRAFSKVRHDSCQNAYFICFRANINVSTF